MDDLSLPVFASYGWLLGVFVLALAIFHLLFLRFIPLSKVGWKRVDYVWLACALLAVLAGVGAARQFLARNILSAAESRLKTQADRVEDSIRFGTSGAVCRTFVRSELSPPPAEFERRQREFDAVCAWFTEAKRRIEASPLSDRADITLVDIGGTEPPGGADKWAVESLRNDVHRYNKTLEAVLRLRSDATPWGFDLGLGIVGPFLFALALALRITKVTGEIRLEQS